ncbi:hypothetical protein PGB90_003019 [Kerria lacca]
MLSGSQSGSSHVSPSDNIPILYILDASPSNRRGSAKIISDSTHKNELIRCEAKKAAIEKKKLEKNLRKSNGWKKSKVATKLNVRELPSTSAATSESKNCKSSTQTKMPVKKQATRFARRKKREELPWSSDSLELEIEYASSSESEDNDKDAACQFCYINFTEDH